MVTLANFRAIGRYALTGIENATEWTYRNPRTAVPVGAGIVAGLAALYGIDSARGWITDTYLGKVQDYSSIPSLGGSVENLRNTLKTSAVFLAEMLASSAIGYCAGKWAYNGMNSTPPPKRIGRRRRRRHP